VYFSPNTRQRATFAVCFTLAHDKIKARNFFHAENIGREETARAKRKKLT
jgi:hypothetical protein